MEAVRPYINRLYQAVFVFVLWGGSGCTIQSSNSNHYLTAEKLWSQKNYAASVEEFDRVVKESPNSAMGIQALWRASMTRVLFLNQPGEALKGFELFLERASQSDLAPQAQIEIGDIYFSKLLQYSKAVEHYQKLLASKAFSKSEEAQFYYRIARSYFFLNQLKKAIEWYDRTLHNVSDPAVRDRAQLDLANAWYALGDTEKLAYPQAIYLFKDLSARTLGRNPALSVEARFGEAMALEELDRLEEAYDLFKSIEKNHPNPNVVQVRLIRLDERMKKKRK